MAETGHEERDKLGGGCDGEGGASAWATWPRARGRRMVRKEGGEGRGAGSRGRYTLGEVVVCSEGCDGRCIGEMRRGVDWKWVDV